MKSFQRNLGKVFNLKNTQVKHTKLSMKLLYLCLSRVQLNMCCNESFCVSPLDDLNELFDKK